MSIVWTPKAAKDAVVGSEGLRAYARMARGLLITGYSGVGKTTLCAKLAAQLRATEGFLTHELRKDGRRVGFEVFLTSG